MEEERKGLEAERAAIEREIEEKATEKQNMDVSWYRLPSPGRILNDLFQAKLEILFTERREKIEHVSHWIAQLQTAEAKAKAAGEDASDFTTTIAEETKKMNKNAATDKADAGKTLATVS